MSLDLSLSIASGGLANVTRQIGVVSQNVSNANTTGYVREIGTQSEVTADGVGIGVRTGATSRDIDTALQAAVWAQNGAAGDLSTRDAALSAIGSVLGTPGAGTDLASQLGALRDDISTLANDPSNATQQARVVQGARTLAQGINATSDAVTQQRQAAQDSIVGDVGTLNRTLADVGTLSTQIVALNGRGQSTADLENQRDTDLATLSGIVDLRVLPNTDGSVTLVTGGGVSLPTTGGAPFATAGATISPGSVYPATIPAVTLNGVDVTKQLSGGSLGANLALRDTSLPTTQAQLDEFARTLADRFDAQGLTLFTQPDGTLPATGGVPVQSGYVGFGASISVNPTVAAQPSRVRDGTHSVGGANPFTVNPAGGPSGFTDLTSRLLDYALGSEQSPGVAQPAPHVTGLGPDGTLSAPYAPPADLQTQASALVAAQASQQAAVSDQSTSAAGLQTSLAAKLSDRSGVSIDSELATLTQLQNAYGANAKIVSAVQSLWSTLLTAVTP